MLNFKCKTRNSKLRKPGFTLIEIVLAMAAAIMVTLIVGSLLISGQRSWARAFSYANSGSQLDALSATITFGSIGRKSNKTNYALYEVSGGHFQKVPLPTDPEQIVTGQAVEFRYWDSELNSNILNTSITATAYALFYLEDDKLMLDLGDYLPGGVDASGNKFDGDNVNTLTLAQNVTELEFSHTTRDLAGEGKGCVRMTMTILDPNSNSPTTVTAATLMRNVWP